MAINVQYGPISLAMKLGQQAGQGQYNQQNFQDSNEFLNTLNGMQRTADARDATQMQDALGFNQASQSRNLANAELQRATSNDQFTHAFQSAEVNNQANHWNALANNYQSLDQYRQGMEGVRQQQADAQTTRADAYSKHQEDWKAAQQTLKDHGQDKTDLALLQKQWESAVKERKDLEDPILSKDLGPTRRDDVPEETYKGAVAKAHAAEQARDAKLTAMLTRPTPTLPDMPVQPAGAPAAQSAGPARGPGAAAPAQGPGMAAPPAQAPPPTADVQNKLVDVAAQQAGVRASDVAGFPAPSQSLTLQVKAVATQKSSDPSQQRAEFYRMMVQMRFDPRKQPDRPY